MVSETYEPTKKGKATSAAELLKKRRLCIQSKDLKRLEETTKDFASLKTLPKDSERLQELWQMAI